MEGAPGNLTWAPPPRSPCASPTTSWTRRGAREGASPTSLLWSMHCWNGLRGGGRGLGPQPPAPPRPGNRRLVWALPLNKDLVWAASGLAPVCPWAISVWPGIWVEADVVSSAIKRSPKPCRLALRCERVCEQVRASLGRGHLPGGGSGCPAGRVFLHQAQRSDPAARGRPQDGRERTTWRVGGSGQPSEVGGLPGFTHRPRS